MKNIQRFLLRGCAFSVLLLSLFYGLALTSGLKNASMHISQFLLILLFSFIISATRVIYENMGRYRILREVVQFVILLVSFSAIFIPSGNLPNETFADFITSVAIFILFYFVVFFIVLLINKFVIKSDKIIDEKKKKNNSDKTGTYKPIYKD